MPNQQIVIFGGPDRCGKTSIAKALSKSALIPYFKPSKQRDISVNDPSLFKKQTTYGEPKLFDFLMQTKHSAIMDRSFVCDWVYSKAFDRDTDWEMIDLLDQGYAKLGAILVLTLRKSYEGWADDANERIDSARLVQLDKLYWQYILRTHMQSVVLHVDDEDLSKQLDTIQQVMKGTR